MRATLERVRADRNRFAGAARADGNEKALTQIERLDDQVRAFEKALGGRRFDAAGPAARASMPGSSWARREVAALGTGAEPEAALLPRDLHRD